MLPGPGVATIAPSVRESSLSDMAELTARPGPSHGMPHGTDEHSVVLRYLVAVLAVAAAFAVRMATWPDFQGGGTYPFAMPAVLVAGAFGGLGPGLLATVLGIAMGLALPPHEIGGADIWNALILAGVGVGAAAVGERLRRTRMQASASMRDLLAREAHLSSILDTVPDAMIVIDESGRRAVLQQRGRASLRLPCGRGDRQERQDADALALPGGPRRLSRALPEHRRAAHHRHRPRRRRRAQGRLDLSHGTRRRRDALERPPLLHRLHPRPDRAPADRGAPAGAAVRARPHLAADGDGRDGLDACPRAQPAALGDRQLPERLAPPPRAKLRRALRRDARRPRQGRRAGAARRPDHPPPARFRQPRRERAADREPREAGRGGERAGAGRRQGARRQGPPPARSARATWCWPTRCRSSRCSST